MNFARVKCNKAKRSKERGNILFMILIAVVLIGALSAAMMSGGEESGSVDKEDLVIKASEVQRYASELERAITFILQNGVSESDIRFSHPDAHADYDDLSADADKSDQVFHRDGGGAAYRAPPAGINDGSAWEFYGGTHLPSAGSNKPELIAVLPNVTVPFCEKINSLNNQPSNPLDLGVSGAAGNNPGTCLNIGTLGRFSASRQFYTSDINTVDETSFAQDTAGTAARTALQACVQCQFGKQYYFYHVLMVR